MARPLLSDSNLSSEAARTIENFHADVVKEVQTAVRKDRIVVVGMAQNIFVRKVRSALDTAKIPFTYLEYGSYLNGWKKRLAIKLWSGWPTYPQVFVDGKLVGGCSETQERIEKGELK